MKILQRKEYLLIKTKLLREELFMSSDSSGNQFIYKATSYAEEKHLIKKDSHIVVGVSGGADSVCLFLLLMNWKKQNKIKEVTAVHINHMFRGQEAIEDKEYVKELCNQYNIKCYCFDINVSAIAKEKKISEEEAGREVRYHKFLEVLNQVNGTEIAVAHHKNDNEETIFLNLLRGSSVKGLRGIQAKRGNIIRPLLCMEREEIEAWLKKQEIDWREDRTNREDIYTRNKLRLTILPMLKKEINPKLGENLIENGQLFGEIHTFLTKMANEFLNTYSKLENGCVIISLEPLKQLDVAVARYVFLSSIEQSGVGLKDITKKHIDTLLNLVHLQVGKMAHLPYNTVAKVGYNCFMIGQREKLEKERRAYPVYEMKCTIFPYDSGKKIQESTYTKWFDYDTINGAVKLRTRQNGDMIQTLKNHGEKKLKDFFINEKIPREERDHILLVAKGQSILWVVGHRISEAYKVSENTKTILQIELIEGGNENGR